MQCNAVQCNAMQCNAGNALYSTVMQCNGIFLANLPVCNGVVSMYVSKYIWCV